MTADTLPYVLDTPNKGLNISGRFASIMCLAIPARVLDVEGDSAKVDFGNGTVKNVSVALLDSVRVGQYVIVHAGFAIQVMDKSEAKKTLDLWQEMLETPQIE
jgi:hydrogenase expression/formation protein HypC